MNEKQYDDNIRELIYYFVVAPAVILIGMAVTGQILDSLLDSNGWFKYIFTGIGGGPAVVAYYIKLFKEFKITAELKTNKNRK